MKIASNNDLPQAFFQFRTAKSLILSVSLAIRLQGRLPAL